MSIRKSLSWLRKDLWQRLQNVAMTLALLASYFQLWAEDSHETQRKWMTWNCYSRLWPWSSGLWLRFKKRKEKHSFWILGGNTELVVSFGNINVMYRVGFMAWSYLEFRRLRGIKCCSYSMGFGGWMVYIIKREICAFKALCIAEHRGGILEFITMGKLFFTFKCAYDSVKSPF